MSGPLRVLIVEDSEADMVLVVRELERGGYDVMWEPVETVEEMAAALETKPWDLVIADYSLPNFSAPAALVLVKERGLDLPFLVVSGTIGEDVAVATMKMGAHDYILKGHMKRLCVAVERELREAEVRRERRRAQEALRETEQRYQTLYASMSEGVGLFELVYDSSGQAVDYKVLDINPAWEGLTQRKKETLIGKRVSEFHANGQAPHLDLLAPVAEMGKPVTFETFFGSLGKQLRISAFSPAKGRFAVTFTDITQQKQLERSLVRVNRALRALSACNQSVVCGVNEEQLLHEVCRIIVSVGQYRLAWVGMREPNEGKSIRPVAWAGHDEGYVHSIQVTWADEERGQGPTGTAIRTAFTSVISDIGKDPRFVPWREEALKRGYGSVVGVPLMSGEEPFGALTIHAAEPNAFDDEELSLLKELADNFAHGILTLRMREERARAEVTLQTQALVLENMVEGSVSWMRMRSSR